MNYTVASKEDQLKAVNAAMRARQEYRKAIEAAYAVAEQGTWQERYLAAAIEQAQNEQHDYLAEARTELIKK